ncbi:type II toxin-antitoxin system VapC family toxin [Chloroflexota bacterium]
MAESRFLYWDTDVFLSYLNEHPDRISTLQAILDNISKDKQHLIVTSTISKVEVAWVAHEKLNRTLNPDEESRIDTLWNDLSVVDFVEFHDDIAIMARDIMRTGMIKGWKLKTNDAIHLASAQWVQCYEVNTYDDKWEKYKEIVGIDIKEPSVIQPTLF